MTERSGPVRIDPADPGDPDAVFCLAAYLAELDARFPGGFDPAASLPAEPEQLTEPHGLLLVARLDGRPVGCGAVKLHGRRPAEIKRMWVAADARGTGVASRILRRLEDVARAHGARTARLETNAALVEAIALYRRAGYREVAAFSDEPYAHHWFEKALVSSD